MRKLFLYGGIDEKDFAETTLEFVKAIGENPKIAVLMHGEKGWEEYFSIYKSAFIANGAREVYPIYPQNSNFEIAPKQIIHLQNANGIFVCGGYTFRYIKIYAESVCADIIREKYNSGMPYGGLSAGAILTIRLGFLKNISLKPHFTDQSKFYDLIKKMRKSKTRFGFGIDDKMWLKVINETEFSLHGKNSFYLFERNDEDFKFKIYHSGMKIRV